MTDAHPSDYALDRGGSAVDAHVAGCAACLERRAKGSQLDAHFGQDILPRTLGRLRRRFLGEKVRRRRWWALGLSLGATAVAAAVLLVARPRPHPSEAGWDGIKGAAIVAGAPGLSVFVKRGNDVKVLEPGQALRPGDALRFVARLDRPRFLELRARDPAGREHTLFPDGPTAAQLRPGQPLPGGFVVDAAPGPERLTVLLSDRPFAVGRSPGGDVEIVRIELPKEP
jgi:hypothetical protein